MLEDEQEYCEWCGEELFDDGEFCLTCDEGPFCCTCLNSHERDAHALRCHACGVVLEVDPPCPICHHEFCECCISTHVKSCQAEEDIHIGIQTTIYSFMFQDGLI